MKQLRRIFATAVFLITASSVALAIQPTGVATSSHTTVSGSAPDTFTFPQFNPNLGMLNSITITFTYSITANTLIANFTQTSQAYTNATASIPLTLTAPLGLSASTTAVANPSSGSTIAPPIVFSGPGSTATGTLTISVPSPPSPDFSAFTGTGSTSTFTISLGNVSSSGTAGPGVGFSGSAVFGGTTTITYIYTPTVS